MIGVIEDVLVQGQGMGSEPRMSGTWSRTEKQHFCPEQKCGERLGLFFRRARMLQEWALRVACLDLESCLFLSGSPKPCSRDLGLTPGDAQTSGIDGSVLALVMPRVFGAACAAGGAHGPCSAAISTWASARQCSCPWSQVSWMPSAPADVYIALC